MFKHFYVQMLMCCSWCWRTMLRNILLNIYEFSYKQCSCLFCYAAVNFVIGVLPLIVFFFSSKRNIFFREKLIHLKQTCIEDFSEKKVLKEVLRFVTIRTELIHVFTLHTSLKLFLHNTRNVFKQISACLTQLKTMQNSISYIFPR